MTTIEERFAQKLASNDLPVRNRAIKRLKKWISARSSLKDGFSEMELLKLWKGLFVCMWHSDKPLVQEELAGNIAALIHLFEEPEKGLNFLSVFFTTMSREWLGIDRLRLDKFYTLIRKVLHESFIFLRQNEWDARLTDTFSSLMTKGPMNKDSVTACLGVQLHVLEMYLSEFLLIASEGCPGEEILMPCFTLLANTTNSCVIECIEKNILQKLEEAVLNKLNVHYDLLSQRLRTLAIDRNTVGRNRKKLYVLCKRFSDMNEVTSELKDEVPPKKKAKKARKRKKE